MSDKEACLVDCVAYHKSIGCSYKLLCPFLHRKLPADVCRYFWPTINLVSLVFNVLVAGQPGWPEVPQLQLRSQPSTPEALPPAMR